MTATTNTSNRLAALRAQLERYDDALGSVQTRVDTARSSSNEPEADAADQLTETVQQLTDEQDRVREDLQALESRIDNGEQPDLDLRTSTGLFTIRMEQLRIERERVEAELVRARSAGVASSSEPETADSDPVSAHPEFAAELATLLRELEQVRAQARALIVERDRLRMEITQLEQVRARIQHELRDANAYRGPERRAQPQQTFDLESTSAEGEAFDKFFNAETGRDKAREWILR